MKHWRHVALRTCEQGLSESDTGKISNVSKIVPNYDDETDKWSFSYTDSPWDGTFRHVVQSIDSPKFDFERWQVASWLFMSSWQSNRLHISRKPRFSPQLMPTNEHFSIVRDVSPSSSTSTTINVSNFAVYR